MASKLTGKEQLTLKNTNKTSNKRGKVKCRTPVKNIISGFDRKKSRSSMKKIKVVSEHYVHIFTERYYLALTYKINDACYCCFG